MDAEYSGKCCIRYVFPVRTETSAQDIKDASSAALFTLVAQSPQRALDHCRSPSDIENSFWRPVVRFLAWDRQVGRRLRHPIIPGNETYVATALSRLAFIDLIVQETLQRLE
jgi:hypothetical protein